MEYAALIAKAESDLARLEIDKAEALARIEAERSDIEATLRYLHKQARAEPKRHSYVSADGRSAVDLKQVPGRTLVEIVNART